MKSVEINDLLSYHFYGNLKVKDGVKVFVDGVAAEKDNAYEYTLKCVKDDKVYDLTSLGKEAGFYIDQLEVEAKHLSSPLSQPHNMSMIRWKGNPKIDSYEAIQDRLKSFTSYD